jgi:hypothetical protein
VPKKVTEEDLNEVIEFFNNANRLPRVNGKRKPIPLQRGILGYETEKCVCSECSVIERSQEGEL